MHQKVAEPPQTLVNLKPENISKIHSNKNKHHQRCTLRHQGGTCG